MGRPLLWLGRSREDIRAFPPVARQRAGYELYQVQPGLDASDWKPMSSVGPGVREIRIHTDLEHRVIYVASFREGIYVLHAFEKKSRKTLKADIELTRARLRALRSTRERAKTRDRQRGKPS